MTLMRLSRNINPGTAATVIGDARLADPVLRPETIR